MTSTNAQHPELSATKRELLEKRLRGTFKGATPAPLIPRRAAGTPAPLSFAQQRLWFIHQLDPASPAYHLPVALRLAGSLDVPALEQALNALVERHETLRTTFAAMDGQLTQIIAPVEDRPLPVVDLREYSPAERKTQAERLLAREAHRPFDLARGPLLRYTLLRLEEREYVLLVVMHHIISDGWSVGVFFRELEELYHAKLRQQPPRLPELPIQYADYACWQQQTMQGEGLEKHLAFWKEKLAGAPASLALPADHTPSASASPRGNLRSLKLPRPFCAAMETMAQAQGATSFMVLMSALFVLLHKWSRQTDLVVGTVVAGRTRREIENLVGCFMNFLPVRAQLSAPAVTGRDLLDQLRATILEAYAHQDCPFDKVVEALNPERKLNQNPLYNVAFLLQNYPADIFGGDTIASSYLPVNTEAALLDLRFVAEEDPDGMTINCEYDVEQFEGATIEHLLASYKQVLETLVEQPQTPLAEFRLSPGLQAQAEAVWLQTARQTVAVAATFTAEPLEEPLRFWMQELDVPTAIRFAPYQQLFQQLLDPASLLATNAGGVNVVLIRLEDLLPRGEHPQAGPPPPTEEAIGQTVRELLLALQGAAARSATPYLVCLCPDSPPVLNNPQQAGLFQRLKQQLATELATVGGIHLVTAEELFGLYPIADYDDPAANQLGHVPYTPLFFAALGTLIARKIHALRRPPKKVIALDCDQTLWTGVCGEDGPRGIQLDPPRLALQQFMRAQHEQGMLLCLCSKNNEAEVSEVFQGRPEMPLRREHFAARRINWHPKSENLRALAQELRLGLDSFVLVDDNPLECAEVEANCPEVLTIQLPEDPAGIPQFLKHLWAFDHLKTTAEDRGRPAQYHQNRMREQLLAESPSLADFLAGLNLQIRIEEAREEQLARIAQLTQRTNQFNCTTRRRTEGEVARLWREGPLRILAVSVSDRFGDYGLVGVLLYETAGEALVVETFLLSCRVLGKGVEHRLLAHLGQLALKLGLRRVDIPFVATAKNQPALDFLSSLGASFRQGTDGDMVFRFPVEVAAAATFDPQTAEAPVERPLPSAPKPTPPAGEEPDGTPASRYRWIALHAQEPAQILEAIRSKTAAGPRPERAAYAPPETETQRQLCALWEELLRITQVGIHDDFFALGGTSLLAVRLFAQIEKQTGRKLPLVTLFKAPTIEQLARILERKPAPAGRSSLVPLQPKGSKPPLFLVHGAGGGILWGYANLAMRLGTDQPLYGIEPRGMSGLQPVTVEELAARYVKDVRAFQPQGPYSLGGYCFGGYVAYEMARQLEAQGQRVALLALIDSAAPNGSYDRVPWWRPGFYPKFLRNCAYWLGDFAKVKPDLRREFVRRKLGVMRKKILAYFRPGRGGPKPVILEEFIDVSQFPEPELQLWQAHLRAGTDYWPKPYGGRVTLFRTCGQPFLCSFDPRYGWDELAAGGIEIVIIPGSHESIFVEPDVMALAGALKTALANARGESNPAAGAPAAL